MVAGKTAKRERMKSGKKAGNKIKIKKGAAEIVEFCTLDLSCKKESNSIINQRYALGDLLPGASWMDGRTGWLASLRNTSRVQFRVVVDVWFSVCNTMTTPVWCTRVATHQWLCCTLSGALMMGCHAICVGYSGVSRRVVLIDMHTERGRDHCEQHKKGLMGGGLPSVEHIFGSSLSRKNLTQLLCMKTYFRIMIYEAWWVVYLCNLFSRCGIMDFVYEVK